MHQHISANNIAYKHQQGLPGAAGQPGAVGQPGNPVCGDEDVVNGCVVM